MISAARMMSREALSVTETQALSGGDMRHCVMLAYRHGAIQIGDEAAFFECMREFERLRPQLGAYGVLILAVSTQDFIVQSETRRRLQLSYPFTSDTKGEVARRFHLNVMRSGQRSQLVPAIILLRDGMEQLRFEHPAIPADAASIVAEMARNHR